MSRTSDLPILDELPALRRYALALSRDEAEADDLVQEALLRGHERRRSFRPGGSLKSWLFGILHNAFVDSRRSRKAEARREAESAQHRVWTTDAPQEAVVRLAQIRDAFLQLPRDQREALHLVAIEGLTYAEAAAIAEVPVGTLMSRVSRARERLRAFEDGATDATGARPALKIVGGRHAADD